MATMVIHLRQWCNGANSDDGDPLVPMATMAPMTSMATMVQNLIITAALATMLPMAPMVPMAPMAIVIAIGACSQFENLVTFSLFSDHFWSFSALFPLVVSTTCLKYIVEDNR